MPDFVTHAASADWQEATRSCLLQLGQGPASLGFLYLTDVLADHAGDILAALKKASGIQHWVGTIGIGICATGREYLDEPALAVMAGDFETGSFRVFSGVASDADVDNVALKCGSAQANFAIVHADPQNGRLTDLVTRLAGKMESGFLVGGLTSSRRQNLQIADGVIEGGLSGVSFSDGVTIATRLTQGCSPLGPKHTITGCQQNVIITLDGRPRLDVFREDIGEALGRDLNRIGSHVCGPADRARHRGLPGAQSRGHRPGEQADRDRRLVQQNTSVVLPARREDRAGGHDAHAGEHT
jgi:small ligand-binding sensory domain FIST